MINAPYSRIDVSPVLTSFCKADVLPLGRVASEATPAGNIFPLKELAWDTHKALQES